MTSGPRNASIEDWIATGATALGALMATLDISITNSALPQIQGAINATRTEGTWISTGYLMSEIVMIPLTAWLTQVFGLRRFLLVNAVLFSAFSMLCGLSHTLTQMIVGRVGQGFSGGAMIPTAQMVMRTRLPAHQWGIGSAVFGLVVMVGPLLGPVLGGWLTENADWSWCFFVNLPVCVALVVLLYVGLPATRTDWSRFARADWLGIVGLSAGLSSLTVILEEGQREHWFDSSFITDLTVLCISGFLMLFAGQFLAKKPVIRLKLLANKSYASILLITFVVGGGIYCVSYLVPQFLSGVAGYNAAQSGGVMLISGLPAFLLMPVLPRLAATMNLRLMLILGLTLFAVSCLIDTALTAQTAGLDFYPSQILRGAGQMLAFMPLNQAVMAAVANEEAGDAAGLYNMVRNLGGSVGLAALAAFIERRDAFHGEMIRESLTANSPMAHDYLGASAGSFLAQHGDPAYASLQAMAQLAAEAQQQAVVLTYSETFYVLGWALVLCVPLVFVLRTGAGRTPASRRLESHG